MTRALLVLASCWLPVTAQAQARPQVFYILSRAQAPAVDPSALPDRARAPYARTRELAHTIAAVLELPRTEARSARLTRIDAALEEAWGQLEQVLERERARLGASGWRVLGEARLERALRDYLAASDASDREGTPMPEHAELAPVIDALRRSSALERDVEAAAWARYIEAWCLLEVGEIDQAAIALRIVAASGPRALRGEARLRLGEIVYEHERGSPLEAIGWYERAAQDAGPAHRTLALYKLAWARYRAGDREGAIAAIERVPRDAREEVRADLGRLRALAAALP